MKSVVLGSVYYSGVYKVGTQIPAGEYYLKGTTEDASVSLSTDAKGEYYLGSSEAYPNHYVTLKKGQYVDFDSLKAYPLAKAPMAPKDKDGNLVTAQYKVGRDIPAGEYVLLPNADNECGALIDPDSTLISNFVGIDAQEGMTYVTVKAGQYLTVICKTGYNLTNSAAPVADISSGKLNNGMYKAGRDFPAGTYTIKATTSDSSTYLVVNNSTHPFSNLMIMSENVFTGTKQVTVADGQYIILYDTQLTLK